MELAAVSCVHTAAVMKLPQSQTVRYEHRAHLVCQQHAVTGRLFEPRIQRVQRRRRARHGAPSAAPGLQQDEVARKLRGSCSAPVRLRARRRRDQVEAALGGVQHLLSIDEGSKPLLYSCLFIAMPTCLSMASCQMAPWVMRGWYTNHASLHACKRVCLMSCLPSRMLALWSPSKVWPARSTQ